MSGVHPLRTKKKIVETIFSLAMDRKLSKLRESGVDVYDHINVPMFAYTGDTVIDVLEREEDLRKCSFLAMEVTFFDDRVSVEKCSSSWSHTYR